MQLPEKKIKGNAALQNAVKMNSIPSPTLFHLLYTCHTHHSHLDYISEVIRRATKMSTFGFSSIYKHTNKQ